jgi:hypothetical protein
MEHYILVQILYLMITLHYLIYPFLLQHDYIK